MTTEISIVAQVLGIVAASRARHQNPLALHRGMPLHRINNIEPDI
jgi:hypothetical protein